jgi:ankyrin repeat protein
MTPLHCACSYGANFEVVRLLVDQGADVHAVGFVSVVSFQLPSFELIPV